MRRTSVRITTTRRVAERLSCEARGMGVTVGMLADRLYLATIPTYVEGAARESIGHSVGTGSRGGTKPALRRGPPTEAVRFTLPVSLFDALAAEADRNGVTIACLVNRWAADMLPELIAVCLHRLIASGIVITETAGERPRETRRTDRTGG